MKKRPWHKIELDVHNKDFIYNNGFNCFYTNADTLTNKMKELDIIAKNNSPKIIAICETKPKNLQYDLNEAQFQLDGYELYVNNLEKRKGRGVAIYVHKSLDASTYDMKNQTDDSLWLKIQMNNSDSLIVGCVYRSPTSTKEQDKQFLKMTQCFQEIKSSHVLILGDFNLPKISWEDCDSTKTNPEDVENKFLEDVKDAFLYQHVTGYTRGRASNKPSLIDLVFTNEEGMVTDLEILSPIGMSDHGCITFYFNCYLQRTNKNFEKFMYDKGNYDAIKQDLDIDWEKELEKRKTVSEKWKFISHTIQKSTANHIPKYKINKSKHLKIKLPLDKEILGKIKKKHKTWKKYINSRDSDTYKEYCKYRNQVRKLTKLARRNQERGIAGEAKTNPKKFWNYVNRKTKTKPGIPNLSKPDNSDEVTKDDQEKADVLLNFFSSVFTEEPDNEIPEIPSRNPASNLENIEITEELVNKKLKNLNSSKSPGPDGIHPRVLKELSDSLTKPLTLLFQASRDQKCVPEEWKTATVSAIYKKGSKKQPGNYRPVSLTCICCKIMESIVRDQLITHMKENDLFSNSQFGFIGKRSTVLQLLKVLDIWTEILDKDGIIDVIYMDFMKAFDKVPHKRLLSKLKAYGLSQNIIEWIGSFLTGRRQRVCVNGYFSKWAPVTSGIPQGSVLGPLLFVLYINDMPDDMPDDIISDIYLFADDTKLFNNTKNQANSKILQEDLNKLKAWSDKWLLRFHPEKCKVLDIGIHKRTSYDYYLGNIKLEHTMDEKDLGVFVDNKLKFDTHIGTKVNKANNILGAIRRGFSYLDKETMLRLYTSLVRPQIEYANPVWSPRFMKDITMVENVQRRATKMIPEIKDFSYEDRLKFLKLPTLAYRRARGDMIETYKILNSKYDEKVSHFLPLHREAVAHPERVRGHSKKLYKGEWDKHVRKHSFSIRIADKWNSLPETVVSAPSIESFERRLDKFWSQQPLKYDYKKGIKVHHTNNTPQPRPRNGSQEELEEGLPPQ